MENMHKGEVGFDANGQHYVLQFSIDAICSLEAVCSKEAGSKRSIGDIVEEMKNPSITLVRNVLWAGLQEHHQELTVKEAGELILAAGGMAAVIGLFGEAFSAAFPQVKDQSPHPRKAGSLKNGTGPRFTRSGVRSGTTTKPSGEKPPA